VEVTQLRTKAIDCRERYFQKNKVKNITFRPLTPTCGRTISTKFCMVIEVVRAIILGLKRFWIQTIVLPLEGVENLAESK